MAETTTTVNVAGPVDFERFGDYAPPPPKTGVANGATFERPRYVFQARISADGASGFKAESGRYHLYISYACPWAHRSAIVRRLKKLEEVVSLSVVDPIRDGRGWAFREGPGYTADAINGFTFLKEAYVANDPDYDGHVSVPLLWDKGSRRIVSNNFPDISIDLGTQFERWADTSVDLYPVPLRAQIDELNELIYHTINNGVYMCGFARSQEAYDRQVGRVFATLDQLERRLASSRFLFGDSITESDVRLWVTLVRFDAVYYSHFKVNFRRIVDYPNLWGYTRDLYQRPAFRDTTNFDHIKRHYYTTHGNINPTRIVPQGPIIDWEAPHGRAKLAG
jgi:glutathionyl-hydroquinone reductase